MDKDNSAIDFTEILYSPQLHSIGRYSTHRGAAVVHISYCEYTLVKVSERCPNDNIHFSYATNDDEKHSKFLAFNKCRSEHQTKLVRFHEADSGRDPYYPAALKQVYLS